MIPKLRIFALALAFLCVAPHAYARTAPGIYGGTPCTQDGTDTDGCYNGGSIQVPNFFTGYAIQSAGASYPSGSDVDTSWIPTASLQPVSGVYPTRPPWNVAGVDYAVGMPKSMMPSIGNLHPAWLKDPALIATDPMVNPDGPGVDCTFVTSNTSVSGGVAAGGTSTPFPFPNDGPGIYCNSGHGSAFPIIFDGYNFSWNSATGYGCIPIYMNGGSGWGPNNATTAQTAGVQVRRSLVVMGPQCSILGEFGQGTNYTGPSNSGFAYWFTLSQSSGTSSVGIWQNTFYGCGGDATATALETALCSATFPSTTYYSGGTLMVAGATVGVTPTESMWVDIGGQLNTYITQNAIIHTNGRFGLVSVSANKGTITSFDHNYTDGWMYTGYRPQFNISSIFNTSGNNYTITSVGPHGIAVGGSYAGQISANGSDLSSCSAIYTMTALTTTTLQITAPTGCSNWTYAGTGNYPYALPQHAHGEIFTVAASSSGATFTGSISGTTLTVSGMTGTLGVGQYITPATGSGVTIPSPTYIVSGSGSTWTLNQSAPTMSNISMTSPYYTIGAQGGYAQVNVDYNVVLQGSSTGYGANTSLLYISSGGDNSASLPILVFSGSVDHNVLAANLVTSGSHRGSTALVEWAYNSIYNFSTTQNYVDPTGVYYCWSLGGLGRGTLMMMSGNVNMLSPSDPYVNMQDAYSILPYITGPATNSQSMNGISYNSSTGVVTVTMSDSTLPPGFGVGSLFAIGNAKVTTGTNYLAGQHAVASVSGNTFTFNVGTGYPGTANSVNPELILYTASGGGKTCYGHN